MKELFEYQCRTLNGNFGQWSQLNCREQLSWVIDNWRNANWDVDHTMVYNQENIVKNALAYGLDTETVSQWVNDPQYNQIRNVIFTVNKLLPNNDRMIDIITDTLKLQKEKIDIRLQLQNPGFMLPMHLDSPKHHLWGLPPEKEILIEKYAIFLEDQSPGQVWLMNDKYLSWVQGDVVKFEQSTIPHGTANFGYVPRPLLVVTGLSTSALPNIVNN